MSTILTLPATRLAEQTFDEKIPAAIILSGDAKAWAMFRLWTGLFFHIVKLYPNPVKIVRIFKYMRALRDKHSAQKRVNKLAYVDGKYYINSFNNGWPGKAFYKMIENEAKRAVTHDVSPLGNLNLVFLAFTKSCPLNCEHCCEGPELNKRNTLTVDDHKKILDKVHNAGVTSIAFGGGEPMARVHDLVEVLECGSDLSDYWMYTSGFNLTEEHALRLKRAGLTGVTISVDHHDAELHNKFRRNSEAFQWAMQAAKNAVKANLVVTFTVCVTRDFCTRENLQAYTELAGRMGASFVQLGEARATGNYEGKDVDLTQEQVQILESFFLECNRLKKYAHLPVILYPSYHSRKKGCSGSGEKYIYVDTDGYITACPYCRNSKTHILDNTHDASIAELKADGCSKYQCPN